MPGLNMLDWRGDGELWVGDTRFRVGPVSKELIQSSRGELLVLKPPWMVEQYADFLTALAPRNVVELGIFEGGSTALVSVVARPRMHVAVDLRTRPARALEAWRTSRGLEEALRTYYGVDQADRAKLTAIVDGNFAGEALDLVVDDASHLLEPTRASFETLFPHLRPGGVYLIEDWSGELELDARIANDPELAEQAAKLIAENPSKRDRQTPLAHLLLELVLVHAYTDLIDEIDVRRHWLAVRRGSGWIDAERFAVSGCYGALGRSLLSDPGPS